MSDSKLTPSSAAYWRSIGQYTAAQGARLLLVMEPQGERISDTTGKARALARRIAERFNLRDPGSLVITRRKSSWPSYADDHNLGTAKQAPAKRTTISLAELERFAYEAGLTDSPLFSKAAAKKEPAADMDPRERTSLLLLVGVLAEMQGLELSQPHKAAEAITNRRDQILPANANGLRNIKTIAKYLKEASEQLKSFQ